MPRRTKIGEGVEFVEDNSLNAMTQCVPFLLCTGLQLKERLYVTDSMKSIICTPYLVDTVTGNNYAVGPDVQQRRPNT
jgi:hypothetical protein